MTLHCTNIGKIEALGTEKPVGLKIQNFTKLPSLIYASGYDEGYCTYSTPNLTNARAFLKVCRYRCKPYSYKAIALPA
ncbi:hypothetical protein IQ247_25345 [Plectonema cf. radiosum LEGE 06105]|uniref:Uncharacterized protein n=1 Tax=Plectonema cf. radiosum LEGE 06105 TaxID=945769 RepID=A0A8J7K446_9CYAN|nr:hypothetical protein [Plectonema radiosum]MBE9215947.1 hypothetical protein [Plectonema cf. radiosum LEGE 06105]